MTDTTRIELELVREEDIVRVFRMQEDRILLGRDLTNTVVLLDGDVSNHHAVVSRSPAGLVVEDLRSTNGTYVNGTAISAPTPVSHGDQIRLGSSALLRVRAGPELRGVTYILKDLRAGTAHIVDADRFRIGTGDDCDVLLAHGPRRAGTVIIHSDGDVWLGVGGAEVPLTPGDQFVLGDNAFRLEAEGPGPATTMRTREPAQYPYRLVAALEGVGGVLARVEHIAEGYHHTVSAPHRASLLYTLARRLCDDRAADRHGLEAGWCDDEDVMIGIWGKSRARQTTSHYSVLMHRLRKELEDARFDPWFIEKRRGATRLRLDEVQIT